MNHSGIVYTAIDCLLCVCVCPRSIRANGNILFFQDLYKQVRAVLNKLTPQKFGTLIQQIMALKIDTEERLKGTIDLIFEKVCQLYSLGDVQSLFKGIQVKVTRLIQEKCIVRLGRSVPFD